MNNSKLITSCRFLYATYHFQCIKLLLLLTTCFLLSPITTLWTAAFTSTQPVSCHLHSHSITMSYVKGDNAVQNARQEEKQRRGPGVPYVLLCEILLPWQQSAMKMKLLETFKLNCSGMVWKQNDSYSTFAILCGRHMLYIIVNTLNCWHWPLVFFFLQLLHCELLHLLLLSR